MAYDKFHDEWKNDEDGDTPITAEALDHMEEGIEEAEGTTSVEVDSTETVDAGEDAEVSNEGSSSSVKLKFKIPRGKDGSDGEDGSDGDKGDTGDSGEDGSDGDKGDTGDSGEDGSDGDKGDTGDDGSDGRGVDDIEYDSDEDELVFKMTEGDDIRIPWPDRDES